MLTPEERRGDFSALLSKPNPIVIRDPLNNNQPFPDNIIPSNRLNPVSLNLINTYMPLPNTPGVTNYSGVSSGKLDMDMGIVRIDEYLSEKDLLFGHYVYARRDFPNIDLNPNFYYNSSFPNSSLAIQYVRTFSSTFLNEARFGWMKANVSKLSPRTNTGFTIDSLGIMGLKVGGPNGRPLRPNEQGFPVIGIDGFMGMGDSGASSNL
ncbi:MAG: hypothetical protein J2P31_13895, partial [Blastocatellia bacterium]|nr:hypothetical protein [Blastocatellia bacterium]